MCSHVEFLPPKGASIPEGLSDGDTFDMVCTFKMCKNGVALTKMGDADMDDTARDEKPTYSKMMGGEDDGAAPEPTREMNV